MRRRYLLFASAVGAAIAAFDVSRRYRRDLAEARTRLSEVHRREVPSDWGAIEYAGRGDGEPLLVLHGIFGVPKSLSNADVNNYDLGAIGVPTLLVHTKDDTLASHDAARRAAAHIPGARFLSLPSGGHLMLGQTEIVRREVTRFLDDPVDVELSRSLGGDD